MAQARSYRPAPAARPPLRRISRSKAVKSALVQIALDGYTASHWAVRELKADGSLPANTKLGAVRLTLSGSLTRTYSPSCANISLGSTNRRMSAINLLIFT